MKGPDIIRCAVSSCVAAALLAGCGGSQPAIGAPGPLPQSPAISQRAAHGRSWMKPAAKSGDLIYGSGACGGICVLSYPEGQVVGSISLSGLFGGDCSDAAGNVFVTNDTQVLEFAHGGISPIATLSVPGDAQLGCAIDPLTGNLAVTLGGRVAVFRNASGLPTIYDANIDSFYCGYDGSGNLFVNGYNNQAFAFSELSAGGSQFVGLSVNGTLGDPGQVQWDGKYITYESRSRRVHANIFRLKVAGSTATIVGRVHFRGLRSWLTQSWIHNGNIFVPFASKGIPAKNVDVWKYPSGGKMTVRFRDFDDYVDLQGVTLSVAPR